MAQIRLWKLGSLEHGILPTKAAIQKLTEVLTKMDLSKDSDIIWDDTLYGDKWEKKLPNTPYTIPPSQPMITDEEIKEFRDLLEKAREYDKKNHEPNCELEEKKQKIRDLAKQLGIEDKIDFIDIK